MSTNVCHSGQAQNPEKRHFRRDTEQKCGQNYFILSYLSQQNSLQTKYLQIKQSKKKYIYFAWIYNLHNFKIKRKKK